ncbi:uncharacterized protein LOC123272954 [Cotesia glomerata]|uniref:Uncharacterized protein n=1 Tax=Cotesia glomerata TaxID=32391 RepID=A0AAV7J569_COTGL|nr:uncharacterized protein LOC123272954 [Cotesia glomerata]KAH0564505.1 hypothetical protein KQX54_012457 [Cotesia glomerata]
MNTAKVEKSKTLFLEYLDCLRTFVDTNKVLKLALKTDHSNPVILQLVNKRRIAVEKLLTTCNPMEEEFDLLWAFDYVEECQKYIDPIIKSMFLPWKHNETTLCDPNCERIFDDFRAVIRILRFETPVGTQSFFGELSPVKSDPGEDSNPKKTIQKFYMRTGQLY